MKRVPIHPRDHAFYDRLRQTYNEGGASRRRFHSTVIFNGRTSLSHFASSALMRAPNCGLDISTASTPTPSTRYLMSGWRIAVCTAPCNAAIAVCGVAAGTTMPYQPLTS